VHLQFFCKQVNFCQFKVLHEIYRRASKEKKITRRRAIQSINQGNGTHFNTISVIINIQQQKEITVHLNNRYRLRP